MSYVTPSRDEMKKDAFQGFKPVCFSPKYTPLVLAVVMTPALTEFWAIDPGNKELGLKELERYYRLDSPDYTIKVYTRE
jgi:hypothetical protein